MPKVSAEGRALWHQAIADKVQQKLAKKSQTQDWGGRLEAAALEAAEKERQELTARQPDKKQKKSRKAKHKRKKHSPSSSSSSEEDRHQKKRKRHQRRSRSSGSHSESDKNHQKTPKKAKHHRH